MRQIEEGAQGPAVVRKIQEGSQGQAVMRQIHEGAQGAISHETDSGGYLGGQQS